MAQQYIASIDVHGLNIALHEPFATAGATTAALTNLAIRVVLTDGTAGWGEVPIFHPLTPETVETAAAAVAQERLRLIGERIAPWRRLAEQLAERMPELPAVRAGLEMAIIDAFAAHYGVPLYQLFGGSTATVNTDITIPLCAPARAQVLATTYRTRGFSTVKIKVGTEFDQDLERIKAIHAVWPDPRMILDANAGYSVATTLDLLTELRAANIFPALLEQPLPREDWEGMEQLVREAGVPIAADESCRSKADALHIVKRKAAHVVNIKLAKCGVVEALDIASITRAGQLGLMIGGMVETRLAMGFSAHFAAGLGGFNWIDLDTPLLLVRDPVANGCVLDGPQYTLPDVPGAGVTGLLT